MDGLPGTTLRLPNSLRCNLHCPTLRLLISIHWFKWIREMLPRIQKSSGYILSVRPKKDTELTLTKVINRLSEVGAFLTDLIAVATDCRVLLELNVTYPPAGPACWLWSGLPLRLLLWLKGALSNAVMIHSIIMCQIGSKGKDTRWIFINGFAYKGTQSERSVKDYQTYILQLGTFSVLRFRTKPHLGLPLYTDNEPGSRRSDQRHCTWTFSLRRRESPRLHVGWLPRIRAQAQALIKLGG